ncbi:MAG: adenosine kinase [Pseudomonadota bacterium]
MTDTNETRFDVLALGNAIVDVIATCDDAFLETHGMAKGAMTLVDTDQAEVIYAAMPPGRESSGGSAANTVAAIAELGARTAFVGRVADDQLGEVFAHDIGALGISYKTPPATSGAPTARCLILVTPDAQRTMNTFLGASAELDAGDVSVDDVASAEITYVEGYLWDAPGAKAACRRAMDAAKSAGRRVAFTLSDAFCVDRYRDEFLDLLNGPVDVVFANEAELLSLYQTEDFEAALASIQATGKLAAVTQSEKGAIILHGEERHKVAAVPVDEVVDTTGAGDLFAAGFLWGLTREISLVGCARAGALCASEIISHMGARSERDLAALIRDAGIT